MNHPGSLMTAMILGLLTAGAVRAQEGAPKDPNARKAPSEVKPAKPDQKEQEAPDLDELRKSVEELRAQEKKLRRQIEEIERSLGDLGDGSRSRFRGFPEPDFRVPDFTPDQFRWGFQGMPGAGRSLAVEHGADGKVKIEIRTRPAGGEEQVETYEADSAEELMEKHPELAGKHGLRIQDGRIHFESPPGFDRMPQWNMPQWRTWPGPFGDFGPDNAPAPDDRLGVMAADPDDAAKERFDLGEGEGLVVQSVTPDSIASRLGVKEGDVLLTINGRRVDGPETIRKALRATKKDGTVTVEVGRGEEGKVELSTTRNPPKEKSRPKRERA